MTTGMKNGRSGSDRNAGPQGGARTVRAQPLSEWLTLMLGEVEQKRAESDVAKEERKRREDNKGS